MSTEGSLVFQRQREAEEREPVSEVEIIDPENEAADERVTTTRGLEINVTGKIKLA